MPASDRNFDNIKTLHKPVVKQLFNFGTRALNIKHAQLRMQCSKLNSDLYHLHVVDNPGRMCGHNLEDVNHYLLNCPLYQVPRLLMINKVASIVDRCHINTDLLLYGTDEIPLQGNCDIFQAVHDFINDTDRL